MPPGRPPQRRCVGEPHPVRQIWAGCAAYAGDVDVEVGPEGESPEIRRFVEERRRSVLSRAVATLRDCPDDDLEAHAHRLKGTLALYELTSAAAVAAALERTLQTAGPDGSARVTARADAVLGLESALATLDESP